MSAKSERLRARAKQMRTTAEHAKESAKANLLKFADDWDAIAAREEEREQAKKKRDARG